MTEQQAAPEAPEVSMTQVEELLQADEAAEGQEEPEEAQPEPTPEPAPEPAPEPEQRQGGDLRVALREERERRRQAEQEAAQIKANQRILAAALEQLRPQNGQAPQVPDFDTDPAAHLKHQVEEVRSWAQQMRQQQEYAAQEAHRQAQIAQAEQAVVAQESSFAKQTPDYYEAVDYVRDRLRVKAEALGVPKDQIDAAVAQDMRQFGLRMLSAGQNPAERLFHFAKIEGYNGPREANSAKLSTIAKGAAATRGARSTAPASNGELTMEQAARMSIKEIGRMSDDEFQRLMGG
jgi:hypothetical protein